MKTTNTCPKCDSKSIWEVKQVSQPHPVAHNVVNKMVVTARIVPPKEPGLFSSVECVKAGKFEVRVCAKCGYTEWYAVDANEMLATLAQMPGMGVRLIEMDSPQRGPFR